MIQIEMNSPDIIKLMFDFAYGIQKTSNERIEGLEFILPLKIFNQLEKDLKNLVGFNPRRIKGKIILVSNTGVTFSVSTERINKSIMADKLKQCYKILCNDI